MNLKESLSNVFGTTNEESVDQSGFDTTHAKNELYKNEYAVELALSKNIQELTKLIDSKNFQDIDSEDNSRIPADILASEFINDVNNEVQNVNNELKQLISKVDEFVTRENYLNSNVCYSLGVYNILSEFRSKLIEKSNTISHINKN